MKKTLLILSLSALLILSGCGKSSNVVEYNDSFVALVKECTDSTQELFKVYQANDSTLDSISESLDNSIKICENAKERSSKL
jgi:protein involved in sex pheromone biosynthesis